MKYFFKKLLKSMEKVGGHAPRPPSSDGRDLVFKDLRPLAEGRPFLCIKNLTQNIIPAGGYLHIEIDKCVQTLTRNR